MAARSIKAIFCDWWYIIFTELSSRYSKVQVIVKGINTVCEFLSSMICTNHNNILALKFFYPVILVKNMIRLGEKSICTQVKG